MNATVITSAILGAVVGSMGMFVVVTQLTVTEPIVAPEPQYTETRETPYPSADEIANAIVEAEQKVALKQSAEARVRHCRFFPDECR